MAEAEFSPTRLEAISDGVIAVAITIMVLELHPPHDATPAALFSLWPQFVSYVVSFGFVAIYWVNHRYLFRHLRRVDERLLWTNMGLLFLLSLIPFATAYAGGSRIAPFPVAVYATVMLANAAAYGALLLAIRAQHDPAALPAAFGRRCLTVNLVAGVVYALAIPAAFIAPALSLGMNFAVTLMYLTPLPRPE
jgi:uncharacterized membrane protein